MFRAKPPSIFSTCHKMPRLPRNLHLVAIKRSPANAICKNTQRDTSRVLRLPRKMTMDTSKVLRLPRKLQHIFWKRRKSIAPATQNDFRRVAEHVWMSRSATPATRNEATTHWKPPKMTTSAELPIGTAGVCTDGCERLRTVATTNATSSEHTLNPQTPRVKREPLLRIRETIAWLPCWQNQLHMFFLITHLWRTIQEFICPDYLATKRNWLFTITYKLLQYPTIWTLLPLNILIK